MHLLLLLITALLILSILGGNWPFKLYHAHLIQKVAREFGVASVDHGFWFSQTSPEIVTDYRQIPIQIRFLERSIDSLKPINSGLEIRARFPFRVVLEINQLRMKKREWGEFRQFHSGDQQLDSQWFMLTPEPERAAELWGRLRLEPLLRFPFLEQVLISHDEIIVRVRRFGSAARVKELADLLVASLPYDGAQV
jgi:hypothetical protein